MGEILKRYCKHCGEPFIIFDRKRQGAKMYCCKTCLEEAKKIRWKRRANYHYEPVKPHPITCKKCGNTFLGKWGAKYCVSCLETGAENGSRYFRQLLKQRTVNVV